MVKWNVITLPLALRASCDKFCLNTLSHMFGLLWGKTLRSVKVDYTVKYVNRTDKPGCVYQSNTLLLITVIKLSDNKQNCLSKIIETKRNETELNDSMRTQRTVFGPRCTRNDCSFTTDESSGRFTQPANRIGRQSATLPLCCCIRTHHIRGQHHVGIEARVKPALPFPFPLQTQASLFRFATLRRLRLNSPRNPRRTSLMWSAVARRGAEPRPHTTQHTPMSIRRFVVSFVLNPASFTV